jgi:hypothetical protein
MVRWGVTGLIFASLISQSALAGDVPQFVHAAKAPADNHCAALGEGFFAVTGSNACMRISGRISAGVGFEGPGLAGAFGSHLGAANGFNAETAVSGDVRFDTEAGPGRVYVRVRNDTNPRWGHGDPQ